MVKRLIEFGPSAYSVECSVSFVAPTLALVRSIPLFSNRFCYGDLLRGVDDDAHNVFTVHDVAGHGGYSSFALLLHPAIDDTLLASVCDRLDTMNAIYEAVRFAQSTILKIAALPTDLPGINALISKGNHDTWIYARLHESPGFVDYVPRSEDRVATG